MKNILTVLCFVFAFSLSQAQEVSGDTTKFARHSVFVELGGNAGLYSLNYDRMLYQGEWFHTSARIGAYYNFLGLGGFGVPLELNGLIGKDRHYLELGVGITYTYGREAIEWRTPNTFGKEGVEMFNAVFANARLGYRFQKPEGGLFFRAAYTPIASVFTDNPYYDDPDYPHFNKSEEGFQGLQSIWHWFGISMGKSF